MKVIEYSYSREFLIHVYRQKDRPGSSNFHKLESAKPDSKLPLTTSCSTPKALYHSNFRKNKYNNQLYTVIILTMQFDKRKFHDVALRELFNCYFSSLHVANY